jgi:predicted DNA-binding antitoxin AbrB/MazE fold protein
MTAVQAIYDGRVFIPEKPCNITSGSKVTLTIETAIGGISEKQIKLEAFRKLTNELTELNRTDPLPPEFDEIVSQRLHFREIPVL